MIEYMLNEGTDDESYFEITIKHEVEFTAQQFTRLVQAAAIEVYKSKKYQVVHCQYVAEVMCEKFGFVKLEPKFCVNVDDIYIPRKELDKDIDAFGRDVIEETELYLSKEIDSFLKKEREKALPNIKSVFERTPYEEDLFKKVEADIDQHILRESIYQVRQATPEEINTINTALKNIAVTFEPVKKSSTSGFKRLRKFENHLGQIISVGSIVKSSEPFKEISKGRDNKTGYWSEFSGAAIKRIYEFSNGDIKVDVIANGHERCYNTNYLELDN